MVCSDAESLRKLPEASSSLDPLIETWERGNPFLRCHDSRFGATEFNPGIGGGRFHPLHTLRNDSVSTLYGSDTLDGALSETVFHNIPVRGRQRSLRHASLRSLLFSTLAPRRDLKLAQLHGYGLRRLSLTRRQLIETESKQYPKTRRWGEALHRSNLRFDGLIWVSRQHDTSLAIVLFGDRVDRNDLEVVEPPLPLAWGPGMDSIQQAAEEAGIVIIE